MYKKRFLIQNSYHVCDNHEALIKLYFFISFDLILLRIKIPLQMNEQPSTKHTTRFVRIEIKSERFMFKCQVVGSTYWNCQAVLCVIHEFLPSSIKYQALFWSNDIELKFYLLLDCACVTIDQSKFINLNRILHHTSDNK